jgi:hypothetical protein
MGDLARQKINWLALFIPLAFAISYVPSWQNELLLFWCSVIGLIVTSAWIGTATEQLARVKLGNESNGIDAEAIVASPDEAAEWLHANAVRHYPDSTFAKRFPRSENEP